MNLKACLNAQRRTAAFTLLEGIICVAVMGIVFVALYAGMATGFASIRTSEENLRATQIMTEKFEAMRLYNWEQVNTDGFIPNTFTARYAPNAANQGITYDGTIRLSLAGPEPYTIDMRMVTITLSWKSGQRTNTRILTSYIGRYGLQNYVY
jgi:type II secretory pathway pseudopilin PulG